MKKKPTIAELEKILNTEEDRPVYITPAGKVRIGKKVKSDFVLTANQNLGGEY